MILFDPDKCQLTPHSEPHQSDNPNNSLHEKELVPHHTEFYKPINEVYYGHNFSNNGKIWGDIYMNKPKVYNQKSTVSKLLNWSLNFLLFLIHCNSFRQVYCILLFTSTNKHYNNLLHKDFHLSKRFTSSPPSDPQMTIVS